MVKFNVISRGVNIYANLQRIFKRTDMQVLHFFLDKICKMLTYHMPFYH